MPETPIESTFFRDSHDVVGVRVAARWSALAQRCSVHLIGVKDGPAISCGIFDGPRGNASLVARALIALDVETNPVTGEIPIRPQTCAQVLTRTRIRAVIWTTYNHTDDAPRYRVLMPLSQRLDYDPEIDVHLSAVVANTLHLTGVCDSSKYGAASLFFLPRYAGNAAPFNAIIEGEPLDVARAQTFALSMAQGYERQAAEAAARRAANALPPEIVACIEAYNAAHAIPDALAGYGYARDGRRWRSRYQHGIGATTVLPDGKTWVSFSESDAHEGVGNRPARSSSQCACFGDAFSLFVHYEHGGNFRRALASLQSVDVVA